MISGNPLFIRHRCRQHRGALWTIGALRDFFLTAPNQLDRIGQLHRKLRHLADNFHIHGQTPAKAAADDHRMEGDIVGIQTGHCDRRHFGRQRVLHPTPNVELAILEMRGERKGLHHRMVEERDLIFRFDRLGTEPSLYIAFAGLIIGLTFGDECVMRCKNGCG